MRSRLIIIVVAVILGAAAALLAARYLQVEQARISSGAQLVAVLVAEQDLPAGMTSAEVLDKGYVTVRQIPRQYVAGSAISSRVALKDKVVAQPISKDEQITTAMFKYATDVGLAPSTPKDHLAVSIPYEAVRGVAGLIKPGDYVAVVGTFEPGDGKVDTAITKIVLPKAQVLAVGKALSGAISTAAEKDVTPKSGAMLSNADTSADAAPTITLALTPVDVEKLVFAQEEGKVWLALFSPNDPSVPVTTGIRLQQEIK